MFTQEVGSVALLMPSPNILASRFHTLAAQDPLKKEDGTFWTEKDFFQFVFSCISFAIMNFIELKSYLGFTFHH